jgi:hypothetical protein
LNFCLLSVTYIFTLASPSFVFHLLVHISFFPAQHTSSEFGIIHSNIVSKITSKTPSASVLDLSIRIKPRHPDAVNANLLYTLDPRNTGVLSHSALPNPSMSAHNPQDPVAARSLSELYYDASNPPQYPESANSQKKPDVSFYFSRVPSSKGTPSPFCCPESYFYGLQSMANPVAQISFFRPVGHNRET